MVRILLAIFGKIVAMISVLSLALTAINFPFGTDGPEIASELIHDADNFYESVYNETPDGKDSSYVQIGAAYAHMDDIEGRLANFVRDYGLENARTLEVGSGSGKLQDIVDDYTGLDIASSAARFLHKPFAHGSATELPFEDSSFQMLWSVWTLEHVPNPEIALEEMRRVLRDNGYLYLYPAWNNPTWAPDGYLVRPNSDLTALEIAVKYSLYIREQRSVKALFRYNVRALRWAVSRLGPTTLHYQHMEANYDTYYMPDSDAVNSIDCFEAQLWFETRGDQILNHPQGSAAIPAECGPLVIQINKPGA